MKISIPAQSLDALKVEAEALVNVTFATQSNTPLDVEHAHKRAEAVVILAGNSPSVEFARAAEIEGMTVLDLARTISAKADAVLARGNERRRLILQIRAAQSVAEIDALTASFRAPVHPVPLVDNL